MVATSTARGVTARVAAAIAAAAAASIAAAWRAAIATRATGPLARPLAGLLGGALAAAHADGAELPPDQVDALYHLYTGGGVTAQGPALLVHKSLADTVSLSASYFADIVSNASIDVVTTASPYHETRNEYSVGIDYAYRDALMTLSTSKSKEPDYIADAANLDVAQEVFGGLTTLSVGFTRGWDTVGKHNSPNFSAAADHWQYRLGLTQILTPRWLMSANLEAISDSGYLGSPYRAARVFGALVPERDPSTRTSRALALRAVGNLGDGSDGKALGAVRALYRYYWDTWAIRGSTLELGYSRYLGERWLADGYVRYYTQQHATFYSDNFTTEATYVTRNRQLGSFDDIALGAKASYTALRIAQHYDVKLNGQLEVLQFKYHDFTDLRTGKPYSFDAAVLELFVSASF